MKQHFCVPCGEKLGGKAKVEVADRFSGRLCSLCENPNRLTLKRSQFDWYGAKGRVSQRQRRRQQIDLEQLTTPGAGVGLKK